MAGINAQEYLQRAITINAEIDSKLDQAASLRAIATKATTTLSLVPSGGGYSNSSMADAIVKMVDLEAEINSDIDKLVDLKRDIGRRIQTLRNADQRIVLEKRYLCCLTWEQIAVDRKYTVRRIYQLHGNALQHFQKTLQ